MSSEFDPAGIFDCGIFNLHRIGTEEKSRFENESNY
jgi:hypothetical protein